MNSKHRSRNKQERVGAINQGLRPGRVEARASTSQFPLCFPLCLFVSLVVLLSLAEADQFLTDGWAIQSSAVVLEPGEKISTETFRATGWYPTSVPSTVLAALSRNGVYRDLYFGKNLDSVSQEPFQVSWWYRKEFHVEAHQRDETMRLIFDGINYSANVFVNGMKIASDDATFGAFRRFDLDISRIVHSGSNIVAVQVYPPKPGDFTMGFVDWNPTPADRDMGIWRTVKLAQSGPVTFEDPFVQSKLNLQTLKEAKISIAGTLVNRSPHAVSGTLSGEIDGGIRFSKNFSLGPQESQQVKFTAEDTPVLIIQNPRVWWPNNLGSPELYNLKINTTDTKGVSESKTITFGIREVADYINEQGYRGYIVNGKKILIRGGGWVDDMMLQEDPKKLEAQMRYAKHLNLNTIRLEGFWGSSEKLYELADRYGLLLMAGFSCQWEWTHYLGKYGDEPYGGALSEEDMKLLTQYLHDQVLWLRNHPSILVWVLGSDMLPKPELEKSERAVLAEIDASRPVLVSTKGWTSEISGPSAVKMNGPYDYETPNYWYVDTENGGAFGFNTETGPGPQPPPAESIARMLGRDHFTRIDDAWNYHCGRHEFSTMDHYLTAFNKRYGEQEDMEDFAQKAQAANYEAIRPMFEAFGIRKPVATGVVQWMLNAAWPKMYWQLYDYYLMPGGAFYGARKANEPLHIAYNYGDRSIYIVNDTFQSYSKLQAQIKVLSMESTESSSKTIESSIGPNESKKIFDWPSDLKESPVSFLSLKLTDGEGRIVSDNFYWLSSKPDVLDDEKTEWYFTPLKEYADFTPLNELPTAQIKVEQHETANGMVVQVTNISDKVAFFIELKITGDKTGRSVLPVFWDDNYVSLLPGETRNLAVQFSPADLQGEKPVLQYSGWNLKPL